MAFEFNPLRREDQPPRVKVKVTRSRPTRPTRPPYILVSKQAITFPHPQVLESLDNPEFLRVEIDSQSKAVRLTKMPRKSGPDVLPLYAGKGINPSPSIRTILIEGRLPTGEYRPLGGGMFIFDKPKIVSKRKK